MFSYWPRMGPEFLPVSALCYTARSDSNHKTRSYSNIKKI